MKKYRVPYNYLPFEFDKKNILPIFKNWNKLIKSTDFTLGKYVLDFEKKFANFTKSKYCISTNNGTDAIIIALKSLGVTKGDEVITVANTFYATVGAIVACGAKPVLVDCDERFQIDIAKIEEKISKKTKVIIPVHWAGASPEMNKIIEISKKYKIHIVEDACMGIGGLVNNKSPGTFGILGAFSMHPLKSLNVMGDGGMIVTNNKKIYKWILKYRNHGMVNRDKIDFWGVNARIQPLQAIVALNQIKKIKKTIIKRNNNAKLMDKYLKSLYPKIILPRRIKNHRETFSLYMCLARNRDKLLSYLNNNSIEAKIHYPIPLNKQKASYDLNLNQKDFKNANFQSRSLITLPIHQYLDKKQIFFTFKLIQEFYEKEN